jgi:hypothetical protein
MSADLLELTFEGLALPMALGLVGSLVDGREVIVRSSEIDEAQFKIDDLPRLLCEVAEPHTVSISSPLVCVGEVRILDPLIRVVAFEGSIDVTLIFDYEDLSPKSDAVGVLLYDGATEIASRFRAASFACGQEPIFDLATRFFSDAGFGPANINPQKKRQ